VPDGDAGCGMKRNNNNYRNILLIKPGAIGDLLHLVPVIRALHGAYPGSSITLMVGSGVTASLFCHYPLVRKVIVFDRKGAHRSPGAFLRLWREVRRDRYDLVVNFQRSNLKGWLLALAAFPARFVTYHKARNRTVHAVVNHLEALAPLGIDPHAADTRLEFFPGPEAEQNAENMFHSPPLAGRVVVAFNPGTSSPVKCWPPPSFSALGDRLMTELGVEVMIVGSTAERDLVERVAEGMVSPPVCLAGCSLPELGALLKRCSLLVTGDTGPMHLAAAVGTRVVALFGSMDPARSGPLGEGHCVIQHRDIPCVPCRSHNHCDGSRYLECMEKITVDEVFAAVAAMVAEKGKEKCGS
jgi:heptosyltransferase-2